MKAITIRQSWASCVAAGQKNVENRGRHTSHRGPIAIHAGKAMDWAAGHDPRVLRVLGDNLYGLPLGAVIAVADLVDCHEATTTGRRMGTERCCLPWGEADYGDRTAWHLVFANIRALDWPVPCPGLISVPWTLPEAVAAEVEQQLAAIAAAREVTP